ncbi:hypothetical protein [Cytobacillus sp. FSL K6-0265]|uniref:hypothetical protein n=1 Tax=Cytobacillus sp. FSL K6-0265 TaxID=2921448 RepID=UPI0030F71A6D
MGKLKLSQLNDDVEVSIEESSTVYTVAELKAEILDGEPHHESPKWYTIKRRKWSPNARWMIENYIDNEHEDMYEDWDERAWDCIEKESAVTKVQKVLDEVFKGEYATAYWTYEEPVEIDILPNVVNETK